MPNMPYWRNACCSYGNHVPFIRVNDQLPDRHSSITEILYGAFPLRRKDLRKQSHHNNRKDRTGYGARKNTPGSDQIRRANKWCDKKEKPGI